MNFKETKLKKIISPRKKRFRAVLLISGGIFLVFTAFVYLNYIILPGTRIYSIYSSFRTNLSSFVVDLDNKNLTNLDFYLSNFEEIVQKLSNEIDRYEFLQSLDLTQKYYQNFQTLKALLSKGNEILLYVVPKLKNVLTANGFDTGFGTLLSDEDESTLSIILKELPLYLAIYDDAYPKIEEFIAIFNNLDVNGIPSIGERNFGEIISSTKEVLNDFPNLSAKLREFLGYVPDLVGSNKSVNYLVILQNETELRGSGGLLSAWGILNVNNGEISDDFKVTDTWEAQYDIWNYGLFVGLNNIYGQAYLMNFGCGGTELRIQDAGMYPDLVRSTELFLSFYDKLNRRLPWEYPSYDHVILLNYTFAEKMLEKISPIELNGEVITAENLFDFIKSDTDLIKDRGGRDRKQIVADIADEIKDKLYTLPLTDILDIAETFISTFKARDIGLYSKNSQIMNFFDSYALSGRFETSYAFDYLHVNEAQNCALKMNKFLRNSVDQNIYINADGSINRDARINWIQDVVYTGQMDKQYPVVVNYLYRAWVRFVIPNGSENITSDGLDRSGPFLRYRPQVYYDSVFNNTVSDNVIKFDHRRLSPNDPIKTYDLSITYKLPSRFNYLQQGEYRLLIQKHPGKDWEKYFLKIHHGGSIYNVEFILDRDKEIVYKDGVIYVNNYNTKMDWASNLLQKFITKN